MKLNIKNIFHNTTTDVSVETDIDSDLDLDLDSPGSYESSWFTE